MLQEERSPACPSKEDDIELSQCLLHQAPWTLVGKLEQRGSGVTSYLCRCYYV